MHRVRQNLAAALVLLSATAASAGGDPATLHHDLHVRLSPQTHGIVVRDTVELPPAARTRDPASDPVAITFRLHGGLTVVSRTTGVTVALRDDAQGSETVGDEEQVGRTLAVREWVVQHTGPTMPSVVSLEYRGTIHHPLVREQQEYARSFSRTSGTISGAGVFLSGGTWWLPRFGDELITFTLAVDLPAGWDAVSQGNRTRHDMSDGRRRVTWDCTQPMDEAYLVAAQFTEYARQAGNITAQAFLRTPDENLAAKYLEATAQYVQMYDRLIGPYPFEKFALVENFWETGYGMPSFTLLGPRVIRFPFILHSSYPHEILHNWWGNSVFVDWESGNWCEGLTAYMADHLIREGQGRGAQYRRDTLKAYRSYVGEGRDFPLTAFRSRHSSATQAVGYGKCLFVFHMLRMRFGDAAFTRALQTFYRAHRFRHASWKDVCGAFERVTQQELDDFFAQWIARPGAPEFAVDSALTGDGRLRVELRQIQDGETFTVDVPVAVTRAGHADAQWHVLRATGRSSAHVLDVRDAVRVDVDPRFDVFRRLDLAETPPTLAELFGAEQVTLVVPSDDDALAAPWRALADAWAGDGESVQVVAADAVSELPADRAVWVLGSANPWRHPVLKMLRGHGAAATDEELRFGVESLPRNGRSFVMVARHPQARDLALGWVGSDTEAAIPGLARKLPHYGKYSYLAFEGDAPDNVVKGAWPATGSPLVAFVGDATSTRPPMGALPRREPLARLAPVFDPSRLRADVEFLADDAQEGRVVGSAGNARSAAHIAAAFADAGLTQGGADGTWFDTWTETDGPAGEDVTLRNVIGLIRGTDPELKKQSVVVSAHFDHLGRGFPEAREGHAGKIHNGADDNASGVAVMLEVARILGRDHQPARTIVFVAFDGEEWGLKGSRRYAATRTLFPIDAAHSMVNLDTVGRLGDGKLLVLGAGTATEWRHIAMGVGFTTGVESTCVANDPGGSDQVVFHEHGVPAVQLFTGPHEDYHRSTDTADKVDLDGLVKVATWLRETVVYLGSRKEPLTSTLGDGTSGKPARPGGGRRVSLGTMPDFAFAGPGVKVAAVTPGSPAEKAGIRAGDVVLAVDGVELADLRAYAAALRTKAPGDVIAVRLRRGDEDVDVEATLVAR